MQHTVCQGGDDVWCSPGYWSWLSSEMWTTQELGTD